MDRPLIVERVRTASHIVMWVIIIPVVVWILWSALNKRTETSEYTKGATHEETSIEMAVHEYPLSFGCARFDMRGTAPKVQKIKKK